MRLPRIRLAIADVMAAVAYAAVLIQLFRDGHLVPFVGLTGLALALGCWASVRGRRRPAAVCFGASVIAANGAVAPFCVYHEGWMWTGVYIGLSAGIPMILGFGTAWALAAIRGEMGHGRSPSASWPPLLAVILVVSMALTPLMTLATFWPVR